VTDLVDADQRLAHAYHRTQVLPVDADVVDHAEVAIDRVLAPDAAAIQPHVFVERLGDHVADEGCYCAVHGPRPGSASSEAASASSSGRLAKSSRGRPSVGPWYTHGRPPDPLCGIAIKVPRGPKVIFYDYYSDVPNDTVDAFVRERELGRLVTVSAEGLPHIGLYPFIYRGTMIEMHLNRADEQLADLETRPRCVFELDEILAVIPSYWVHPEDAVMATAYHRTVIFDCEAEVSQDAVVLAEQQMRLLARYQPEGGFRPVTPDDPLYRGAISQIAAVRLAIRARRAKFKIGQNRPVEVRARIVNELRGRGRPNDTRAAEALQWTIDRGVGGGGAGPQRNVAEQGDFRDPSGHLLASS